jgi:hypothetical protein
VMVLVRVMFSPEGLRYAALIGFFVIVGGGAAFAAIELRGVRCRGVIQPERLEVGDSHVGVAWRHAAPRTHSLISLRTRG